MNAYNIGKFLSTLLATFVIGMFVFNIIDQFVERAQFFQWLAIAITSVYITIQTFKGKK